jgi:hypothetical protein
MKQAKQWWPAGGKGKADLPEAQRPCAALAANSCGPWFWPIAGQRPVRQKKHFHCLDFWLLFYQENGEALLSAFKNKI